MILMTGGAFQGKLECAKELWKANHEGEPVILEGKDCSLEELQKADIFSHMTFWVRRMMEQDMDYEAELNRMIRQNPDIILESQEIGCGLVPIDAFDRRYREAHGRLCCRLAEQAEAVYRVSCGCAVRIR